jgi:hypothetical protein
MTAERIPVSGGWLVSEFIGGYLVSARYFGFTKRESLQLFRAEYHK